MKIYTSERGIVRIIEDEIAYDVLAVASGSNKVYVGSVNCLQNADLIEVTKEQKEEIKDRLNKLDKGISYE